MNNETSEKNKFATIITAFAVSVFFILAILGLVVFPALKKLYEKKEALEKGRILTGNIKADLSKKDDYWEFQEKIEAKKEMINSCLIGNESVVAFIEKIEAIATETGNQISITPYQPPKKKKQTDDENVADSAGAGKNVGMSFLQVELYGEYANFLQFLYKIENMNYALRIDYAQTKTRSKNSLVDKEENKGSLESKIIIGFNVSK